MTVAEMIQAYEAGATLRDIAMSAGIAHVTVSKRIRAEGVILRRGGWGQSKRRRLDQSKRSRLLPGAEIERAYRAGLSMTRLSYDHGVLESTIAKRLRARGVPIRARGPRVGVSE